MSDFIGWTIVKDNEGSFLIQDPKTGARMRVAPLSDRIKELEAALRAIINRDPARPGPKAAVVVNYSTAVAIAKQALAEDKSDERTT